MRSHCALYVDAGYLLASAATRITGTSLRNGVIVDHGVLINGLIEQVEAESRLPLLRVNWYDSESRRGQGDPELNAIGLLPRVKLRLGRLSRGGEQKGVDVRLGLDLATHGRNRVCDVMYLVTGDDDLTEAVEEAQGHGVQVILLAVPDVDGRAYGVSRHLQRESDGLTLIAGDLIDRAVRKPIPAPERVAAAASVAAAGAEEPATPVAAGNGAPAASAPTPLSVAPKPSDLARARHTAPPPAPRPTSELAWSTRTGEPSVAGVAQAEEQVIVDVCRSVIEAWAQGASEQQQGDLLRGRPYIPGDIDRALLVDVSAKLGIYDLDDLTRYTLRERFWEVAEGALKA